MLNKKHTKQNQRDLTKAHDSYEKGMKSYASFKVDNNATGEDLVQDTFMKTWLYLVRGGRSR